MDVKIALIGAGNVGQGFLAVLRKKREQLASRHGITFQLVSVCDRSHGSVTASAGLKISEILPILEDGRGLLDYQTSDQACVKGLDPLACLELSQADVVLECTHSNLQTGEPASGYIRQALGLRKHVVSSNKGPAALNYQELRDLAKTNGVRYLFGASVMNGTPLVPLLRTAYRADEVLEIRGLLNVTTNFVLAQMEKDKPGEAAIQEAIENGYSEADVALDLEGHDTMAKLMILLNVLSDRQQPLDRFIREGITNITVRDVQSAREKNMRYRMIAHAVREEDGSWRGQVGPNKIEAHDPFYHVAETQNAIQFKSETVGDIYLEGPGSGRQEVGYSMLLDLLSIFVP